MEDRKVFLVAGHHRAGLLHWKDVGAVFKSDWQKNDCWKYEHWFVENFTLALKSYLTISGVECELLPFDKNLGQKVGYINSRQKDGDICIEFHLNSFPSELKSGSEIFYYTGSNYAYNKAKTLIDSFCKGAGLYNRGAKPDTQTRQRYNYFIRKTNPLALLVELGFITNRGDMNILGEKNGDGINDKAVKVMAESIIKLIK